ncbi:hypothetical protein QBC46DRAFT_44008 [Diplogelasinospora grovesii]|uniref:SNARE-complex protein Syntaxin-18 N-terminal domain-containing protein n=1 Tax=Diplogelasinospora grovesii TaxID=303347 RepID=A0AAN6NEC1_9PEZI|nr:hypothetical protein QBC46DRAFT_44008 [Diplogelasinospora grovesii]
MADLTSAFNALLKAHEAPPTRKRFSVDEIDEFLKEAYRISALIARLHTELRNVRQPYLSTAAPRKTLHLRAPSTSQSVYLTDRDREEIDANAKMTLRDLNASIRALEDAEQLRQNTETALMQKKYSRGLGALGSWAAGGGALGLKKSSEQVAAEAAARQLGAHRESVIWFLRQRLQETAKTQQRMMEKRLTREMEKNRSVLAKARGGDMGMGYGRGGTGDSSTGRSLEGSLASGGPYPNLQLEEEERRRPLPDDNNLTDEQRQLFEKGNQDMLKHFESTLDKVRTAEKSLVEISELQNLLVNNLTTQAAHIDQLVADSFNTTENVGGGNKQLKKATERASAARYTFFAATGLCLFLIGWDLLI